MLQKRSNLQKESQEIMPCWNLFLSKILKCHNTIVRPFIFRNKKKREEKNQLSVSPSAARSYTPSEEECEETPKIKERVKWATDSDKCAVRC